VLVEKLVLGTKQNARIVDFARSATVRVLALLLAVVHVEVKIKKQSTIYVFLRGDVVDATVFFGILMRGPLSGNVKRVAKL
jgi:hypothetical protein